MAPSNPRPDPYLRRPVRPGGALPGTSPPGQGTEKRLLAGQVNDTIYGYVVPR